MTLEGYGKACESQVWDLEKQERVTDKTLWRYGQCSDLGRKTRTGAVDRGNRIFPGDECERAQSHRTQNRKRVPLWRGVHSTAWAIRKYLGLILIEGRADLQIGAVFCARG